MQGRRSKGRGFISLCLAPTRIELVLCKRKSQVLTIRRWGQEDIQSNLSDPLSLGANTKSDRTKEVLDFLGEPGPDGPFVSLIVRVSMSPSTTLAGRTLRVLWT